MGERGQEAGLRIEDQRHRHPGFARVKTRKSCTLVPAEGKLFRPRRATMGCFPSSFFFTLFSSCVFFFLFPWRLVVCKVASHSLTRLNSVATGRIVNGWLQGPAVGPSVSILGAR